MPLKAQTQVITIVLISGIVISLVGTAYLWGMPLISKRTTITDFLSAEDFLLNLNDKVVEIANSGSGEASLSIPKGLIKVYNYTDSGTDNNSIILEVAVDQPLLQPQVSDVYLKTSILGENATYGEAEPRVLTLNSSKYGTGYRIKLKLHYRELDTRNEPYRGYKIAIERGSMTGNSKIIVSYAGTEIQEDVAMNGGNLILTKIRVDTV